MTQATVSSAMAVVRMVLGGIADIEVKERWSFPRPHGRLKFDFAVFAKGAELPAFVVDVERERNDFYERVGERPCREHVHRLAELRPNVNRERIAALHKCVHVLVRLDETSDIDGLRDELATYADMLIFGNAEMTSEVACANLMLGQFRYETYVAPTRTRMNKQEAAYFALLDKEGVPYVRCLDAVCLRGEMCPYDLL